MKANKRIVVLAVLAVLIPATGWSNPVSVGGTIIEIPNPPGFAAVTPQMTTVHQLLQNFVAPEDEGTVFYIAESDIPKALNNEMPDLGRRFSVQTNKSLIGVSFSQADFVQLKQMMKTQMDEVVKKVEKALPGQLEEMNKGVTNQLGIDATSSVSQVTLPPHEETDRALAYSTFAKVGKRDEAGNPVSFVIAGTTTVVHVKGKVVILHSRAEESGLAWTRTISKQWADSIIAANPPDLQPSTKESLPPAARGINWEKITGQGAVGGIAFAIAVAIVASVGGIRHRGKGKSGKDDGTPQAGLSGPTRRPVKTAERKTTRYEHVVLVLARGLLVVQALVLVVQARSLVATLSNDAPRDTLTGIPPLILLAKILGCMTGSSFFAIASLLLCLDLLCFRKNPAARRIVAVSAALLIATTAASFFDFYTL
jgi:hypothetical protein